MMLSEFLGGENVAGGKMKEIGSTHWQVPNNGATNDSGFTALPSGCRNVDGAFFGFEIGSFWWSNTEYNIDNAWFRFMGNTSTALHKDHGGRKRWGYSVRCLKETKMSLKCRIGLHSWEGCRCTQCKKINDKLHSWEEFKCIYCNKETRYSSFTDERDGHKYKCVKIGNQIWMAENFQYKSSSGCWSYDNKDMLAKVYGYLYDWETAFKVCPKGWHLPTDDEWTLLATYLGNDAGKIKETGTMLWHNPNKGATNSSGFTALPGGLRENHNSYDAIGKIGFWWSATELNAKFAWGQGLSFNSTVIVRISDSVKTDGLSVRYVKD